MKDPLLKISEVDISFNSVPVLNKVSFDLDAGDILGIAGKNGAGKSTLMKVLMGVYKPDSGKVDFEGRDVTGHQSLGISQVYQDLSLIETLTVAQNIFLTRNIGKGRILCDSKKELEEARKILSVLKIDTIDPNSLVQNLSAGQKQFVEIAKAISTNPKVLILDEPTASLANFEIDTLFEVIETLKKKNISIIYITHYLSDIFRICNSVLVLKDGRSITKLKTKESTIEEVVGHMLGDDVDLKHQSWTRNLPVEQGTPPLLEMRRVSNDRVSDISLKVYPGQVIGLAGLLGSGRTEILRVIFGLDKIYSGDILINNRISRIASTGDAIRSGIYLVPEERREQGLFMDHDVEKNVTISILKRLSNFFVLNFSKTLAITKVAIDKFRIKVSGPDQTVRFLSGGNQQKVVLAKCLSANPQILLLDDPTFGVDIQSKLEIMRTINDYVNQGNGAIFISSEFKEIAEFSDKTYVIKKGSVDGELDNASLTEELLLNAVQ